MSTFTAKNETVQRDWYLVDAEGKTLGRLATELARRLRGKHKPVYTPHVDTGDYLVVINAERLPSPARSAGQDVSPFHRLHRQPEDRIPGPGAGAPPGARDRDRREGHAAEGPLGRQMYRKLKVYAGTEHPHAAQQPQVLDI